ncbi:MAG: hypothetical protein COT85_05125 [Chlamydiae bacterium CG10_big_fil_rev_8_21_14_0_10_42_34]|nr:MAG: hypothetical protein COT85_05125 [Chlamydiae bacterium CG10_big_fil_rev_8_21_14_0_10_42_34]
MSPEGLAYAMSSYVGALKHQVAVAKSFFFGRLEEGMEGLMTLPEDVKLRVDQLIWDASKGAMLDLMEKDSQTLVAAAIMHSLEERMGMHYSDTSIETSE